MVKVGDIVRVEYSNGEIISGSITKVREMGVKGGEILTWADGKRADQRTLATIKIENGYRSVYLDKCVTFDVMETAN